MKCYRDSGLMQGGVAVIMSVYNGEAYVSAALDSVLGQVGVKPEIVVVNDGSTDRTPEILDQYASRSGVRVLHSERIGRGSALNVAWRHTSAEFVANVDADDVFHPDKLRVQLRVLQRYSDVGVIGTRPVFIGAHTCNKDVPWGEHGETRIDSQDVTARLGIHNPLAHSSVLMRRSAIEQAGGYSDGRRSQLDYDLWIRMAQCGWRLAVAPVALVAMRKHERQSFERARRLRYLIETFKLQQRAISYLELPKHYRLVALTRIAYGLLPPEIRLWCRRCLWS